MHQQWDLKQKKFLVGGAYNSGNPPEITEEPCTNENLDGIKVYSWWCGNGGVVKSIGV